MCRSNCQCFQGSNDETKELWESYGEEYLNQFNRTAKESGYWDSEGIRYNKFQWTSDRTQAINSYDNCYKSYIKE